MTPAGSNPLATLLLTIADRYRAVADLRNLKREYGYLVWEDVIRNNVLIEGRHVLSSLNNQVHLYTEIDEQEVVDQRYILKMRFFVGEFHAHPLAGGTWMGQFPSPDDIVNENFSVAGSKWKLKKPFHGYDDLDVSPFFQLIQSLPFGDIFVIEQGPQWARFASLQQQAVTLNQILSDYATWHQAADVRLGRIPSNASEADFATVVGRELTAMNNCMQGRAIIRLHRI